MLRDDRESREAALFDTAPAPSGRVSPKPGTSRAHATRQTPRAEDAQMDAHTRVLALIADAVLTADRAEGERQLRDLLDGGVDRDRLIDEIIPEVARGFGEAWCLSGHSFAEVTIAVARLQGWLRELEPGTPEADPFRLDAPEVLLVVPEGCQHTLGAMVALSKFRRLGALVRLSLGQDARSIGMKVRAQHFDMIALSAAGNEDLEFLADVINSTRSGVGHAPRVVLGGAILSFRPDAHVLVGADFGTSDPEEALTLCGLSISDDGDRRSGHRPTGSRRLPAREPHHA